MQQLIAWAAVCFVASIALANRPLLAVKIIVSLYFVVPVIASDLFTGHPFGDSLHFIHPASVLVVVYGLVYTFHRFVDVVRAVAQNRVGFFIATAGVVLAVVVAVRDSSGGSLLLNQIVAPLGLFILVRVAARTREDLIDIGKLVVVLGTICGLVAIGSYVIGDRLLWHDQVARNYWFSTTSQTRQLGTLDQPLELSNVLSALIPLTLVIRTPTRRYFAIACMLGGVVTSQSRSGLFLALAAVMVVALAGAPKGDIARRAVAVIGLGVASAIALVIAASVGLLDRFQDDNGSTLTRQHAYDLFFATWHDFLLNGGGIGYSYDVINAQGYSSSFENPFIMYMFDLGGVFSVLYFGGSALIVLLSIRSAPAAFWTPAALILIGAQTYSSVATDTSLSAITWALLGLTAGWAGVMKAGAMDGLHTAGSVPTRRPLRHAELR